MEPVVTFGRFDCETIFTFAPATTEHRGLFLPPDHRIKTKDMRKGFSAANRFKNNTAHDNSQGFYKLLRGRLPTLEAPWCGSAPCCFCTLNICLTFCRGRLTLSLCRSCSTSLMLKLPSPFLSASVNVCFSHVMTRWVKERQLKDSGHLLEFIARDR